MEFEKFEQYYSEHCIGVFKKAEQEAIRSNSFHVNMGHFIIGVLESPDTKSSRAMRMLSPRLQTREGIVQLRDIVDRVNLSVLTPGITEPNPEPSLDFANLLNMELDSVRNFKNEGIARALRGSNILETDDVVRDIAFAQSAPMHAIFENIGIDRIQLIDELLD